MGNTDILSPLIGPGIEPKYKGKLESTEVRDSTPHEVAAYELLRNKIHKHRIVLAERVHLTLRRDVEEG